MTLAVTAEQSYVIALTVGVASMMVPIMIVLIRIHNARIK